MCGINEAQTGTTHTIDVADQNKIIEYSNAASIAVTLPAITAVSGSNIHTDDFKVTFKNIGAGVVTVTRGSTDTFDDGSTSISLEQYEFVTIQTDNSLTKWNIINSYIDVVTEDGTQTLTNKTLTNPTVTGTLTGDVTGNLTGDVTGNADTVTTNANLTGDVTSVGNATTIANSAVTTAKINDGAITEVKHTAITAGATYKHGASAWNVEAATTGTAYVAANGLSAYINSEIIIARSGTYTCDFDLKTTGATAYAKVYKNAVAFGSELTTTQASFTSKSEDLTFTAGDRVSIYIKATSTQTATIRDFRILSTAKLLG
jgi:hypothetical protein